MDLNPDCLETNFARIAPYYDKIYAGKNYAEEAARLSAIIADHRPGTQTLLDVACGTGRHIEYLKETFQVTGLDICSELLMQARQRNPGILFHCADMTAFDLGKQFDVITCLFGSIGYVATPARLRLAVRCMARHLRPGGLLLIEPFFSPETWQPNKVHGRFIDEAEFKLARINTSQAQGRFAILDLHHLIGTPEGTDYVLEHHELGLFEIGEIQDILAEEGVPAEYDLQGLTDRGLLIGRKLDPHQS